MPPRELHFDFGQMEDFEVGAALLAILAYPAAKEASDYVKTAEALCAMQAKAIIAASDPEYRRFGAQPFQPMQH